jgi:hypothetical protein
MRTAPAVRTAEVPNEAASGPAITGTARGTARARQNTESAADLAAVTADTVQGVRWRALVGRHSVRQQAFRGREVKAGTDAARGSQDGEFPDPGVAGQQQHR